MSRRTLQHTLVATVAGAAVAVAASPAVAKPVDRVDRFDHAAPQPHPYQDYRGEQALEAARLAEKQEHFLPGQPTWPTHPQPAPKLTPKPASSVPASDSSDGDVWLIVGLGVAAAGIVGGSAVGVRRSRVRARRVAV